MSLEELYDILVDKYDIYLFDRHLDILCNPTGLPKDMCMRIYQCDIYGEPFGVGYYVFYIMDGYGRLAVFSLDEYNSIIKLFKRYNCCLYGMNSLFVKVRKLELRAKQLESQAHKLELKSQQLKLEAETTILIR